MSKLKKGKVLGIAAACLLVASLAGALVAPAILADDVPSVSIIPEEQGVEALGTFDIDVRVDAAGRGLAGIGVAVQYNSNVMTTTKDDVVVYDLVNLTLEMGPDVTEAAGVGEVSYVQVGPANVPGVDNSVMKITFTMLPAAEAGVPYPITVSKGALMDDTTGLFEDTETKGGTVKIPPPAEGASVSIDLETTEVMAGNSFTIDVLVDAADNDLTGIDVQIAYDADTMTTSLGQITAYNLLDAPEWGVFEPAIDTGEVRYALLNVVPQTIVSDLLMTIEFTVDGDAVPDDYALTITRADLLDENGVKIPDVAKTGGVVTVLPAGPVPPEEFTGTLAKGDREYICTIPGGAEDLEITLITEEASPGPDMDLELYDEDTLVIGYKGEIRAPGGTYEGDVFGYSGYKGGKEDISAGAVSQPYDLKVYAFRAGTYTVTVSYVSPGPDLEPPEITIDVPATVSLEDEVTITVSATDPGGSGVQMLGFWVYPEEYPEGWDDGYPVAGMTTFTDEGSLTFVPGWAGTYTVEAWAADNAGNPGEETDTFVVSE